jgi:hypothetical protein
VGAGSPWLFVPKVVALRRGIPNQCLFFFFFLNPRFGEILTKKIVKNLVKFTLEKSPKNPISVLKNGKISSEKKCIAPNKVWQVQV